MAKILSTEDGKLQGATLVTSRQKVYSDIDLTFGLNSSTGDVFKKKDAAAVKQAVKNLLQTNRFEKPFRPDFGADLRGQLFNLADLDTEDEVREQIYGTIARYEPRASIKNLDVRFDLDRNACRIRVEFGILSTDENVVLETTVSRLR